MVRSVPRAPGGGDVVEQLSVVERSSVVGGSSVREAQIELRPEARTELAAKVLDPAALDLIARLHPQLEPGRRDLLAARQPRQRDYEAGRLPDYLPPNNPPPAAAAS